MSGTKAGWTPERRAAQAARMRAVLADPIAMAKRARTLATSEKVAAARRSNMLKVANDPAVQAKCRAWRDTPEGRAAAAKGGTASVEKRRNDPLTRVRHQAATAKSNQSKAKRMAASRSLKKLWRDPSFAIRQTERAIRLSRDPQTMVKAWDTRRAGKVPKQGRKRYYELRDKIGAKAALAVVKRELVMAEVNA